VVQIARFTGCLGPVNWSVRARFAGQQMNNGIDIGRDVSKSPEWKSGFRLFQKTAD